ncbi:MAG: hypothetical protein A2509_06255 [Candidatus Edwardsbacteria bacterium RIFOXYD12_FULL_50_11]|nr:MAG: hypothetical protein A2273_00700 [Candidatus Edwardsbacteria bacterium RifOxyA12_full_54_48]OGF15493.1 MAG: hypothetical protein A2509_06255 [Candidatus Edwardsbacteria bacterium RIFOXYD12_FULL_50_11]
MAKLHDIKVFISFAAVSREAIKLPFETGIAVQNLSFQSKPVLSLNQITKVEVSDTTQVVKTAT